MNRINLIKKSDVYIISLLLIISITAYAIVFFTQKKGNKVEVYVDNKLTESFDLNEDKTYQIKTEKGYNILIIDDGSVWVDESDCNNQICVKHKKINKVNEEIICLPHRVRIVIK